LKTDKFQLRHCPRVHLKLIVVDGQYLYIGSANFTGAGLGARGEGRRNFELGITTDDDVLLDAAQLRFDRIWQGRECGACKLRSACPKPLDIR
jgi:phosphatidylserine/phosphatidylglycerophosphate/cardiolipin synthase-like enzyme